MRISVIIITITVILVFFNQRIEVCINQPECIDKRGRLIEERLREKLMSGNRKKLTIGLLVGGIGDKFSIDVCQGIISGAKKADVNFVVYPGKYINRDLSNNEELRYEYQFNTLFSYPCVNKIDGLIISLGSIGIFANADDCRKFLEQFKGIPIVIVAMHMDGYVDVGFDNYAGIKDALEYLIRDAKCRKIGMIGGNCCASDAAERKQAFYDILKENDIEVEDRFYVEGTSSNKSYTAYKKILNDNEDLEAVFCVNDDTAMGFYQELNARKIKIGKELLVVGFDDSIMASKANPPLASVRADAEKLAKVALDKLIKMINGKKVESEVIPTKFILRDSVGSISREDVNSSELNTDVLFDDIFFHFYRDEENKDMPVIRQWFHEVIVEILSISQEGINLSEKRQTIKHNFEQLCNTGVLEYAEIDNLMNLLEGLYNRLKGESQDILRKYYIKSVFSDIYLLIIRSINYRFGNILAEGEENNYAMKVFIRDMLAFERGNDQSYVGLLQNLDWLKIENAYIYMFERPIVHLFGEDMDIPEKVYLKAARVNGKSQAVLSIDQEVSIKDIFSNKYTNPSPDFGYTVLPLFNNENLYGLLVCDLTEELFANGEFLTNQMSSAAKMIMLLQDNEEIQKELENSLAALKANNVELDTLSKSDLLTGIYNRRGFYISAEGIMENCRKDGKSICVVYVDMNNLKIINDRYGHEEGDFSLKAIGDVLVDVVGSHGAVGRIGGDEFACILDNGDEISGDELVMAINKKFEVFNKNTDKPYNVTVCTGTYKVEPHQEISVEQALTLADEKLYDMKKQRKKNVAKE